MHKYNFKSNDYHLMSENTLDENELKLLDEILSSFPKRCSNAWIIEFLTLDFKKYSKHLLQLAANAYDDVGNTMLGLACYWEKINPVKKLVMLGANINVPDHHMNKLPLHWAISSSPYAKNFEANDETKDIINFLLNQGTHLDNKCYADMTPLEYAKAREFRAAASLIESHLLKNRMRSTLFEIVTRPHEGIVSFSDIKLYRN